MTNYDTFLLKKRRLANEDGFKATSTLSGLFPFQRDIVLWALRKGRAAIFADCGL